MMLGRFVLGLPQFKGKGRLTALLAKKASARNIAVVQNSIKMDLDLWEYTQQDLLAGREIEPRTIRLLQSLLRPGDNYIDVGAHVGFHSLFARKAIGPRGVVVAVEPQPYNCQKILRNWELNGFSNIVLYIAAASDATGFVTFEKQPISDSSRLSMTLPPIPDQDPQRFRVPLLTLSAIAAELDVTSVRVLKLDVEGHEPEVLAGAREILKSIENIILELLESESDRSRRLLEFLTDNGYELLNVEGEPWHPAAALPESNVWARRREPMGYSRD